MKRRDFLRVSAGGAIAGMLPGLGSNAASALDRTLAGAGVPESVAAASDEAFWREIRTQYVLPDDHLDLDQASCSPTARPVFDGYVTRSRALSAGPAERFTKLWAGEVGEVVYPALAGLLGTRPKHIALMLNATTALNTVLHGFPLQRGDEILVTNHEYPDMVQAIQQRGRREGVVVRKVDVPALDEHRLALVERVSAAISPRTRLLLISHVSAWSGEILPVAEVTAAARQRGVAVLMDAAQSVGMLDVNFEAIGCDFLATSLHKWLGAPIASGVLVMRPEHVGSVWPLNPPAWDATQYPMDLYEWSGTVDMAARAAVVDALAFQKAIGSERKLARMRHLGEHWQAQLRNESKVRVLTPRDPDRAFGVAALEVDGVPSATLQKYLREERGILVQDKAGRHSPFSSAVRVSPGPHTEHAELDRFVSAIRDIARRGLS
jgi:selenocysteine lyase/cysteine desulfurase